MKTLNDREPKKHTLISMEIRDIASLVSSLIFLGLSFSIAAVIVRHPGAPYHDLAIIALMTGVYGIVRLWRTIYSIRNRP